MRYKLGNLCIALGAVLLAVALLLLAQNQQEDAIAGDLAAEAAAQLEQHLHSKAPTVGVPENAAIPDPYNPEMTQVEIDGHFYIGYLTLPTLEEHLPVMADWSEDQLKIAPCRYAGSAKTDDLVLMAHNYDRHFGTLGQLKPGQIITLTDMDRRVHQYEVIATEVLGPDAVENMLNSGFDLTLFTCTYGGQNRVTVRCDRVE